MNESRFHIAVRFLFIVLAIVLMASNLYTGQYTEFFIVFSTFVAVFIFWIYGMVKEIHEVAYEQRTIVWLRGYKHALIMVRRDFDSDPILLDRMNEEIQKANDKLKQES